MPIDHQFARCAPESQGLSSSAIRAFIEAVEDQGLELHSFLLLRHGVVVAEGGWSPYHPGRPHMLFSLSKSFTSTAVGLAVVEGRLSVDDPVLSFFPDEAPARISGNLRAMRVRHLLSMSTGHAEDTMETLHRRRDGNWIKAFLARPVKHEPGTFFLYNTGATYMLSAIIQQVTSLTLLDYLRPRLFEPLGIQDPVWEMSPQGINTGGFGLTITTEDIARFGQLYLQKGKWHGQQLVPEAWVEQATSWQIDNGSDDASDWAQGYGYQFWRCRHGAYRGDGAFGQYCIVMPDQDAVLAITSGLGDMQAVLNLVWAHLLPAMGQAASLPEQPQSHARLTHKLENLVYLPPQGKASSPLAASISGKKYMMEANPLKIKAMAFDFSSQEGVLTLWQGHNRQTVVCGAGAWRDNRVTPDPNVVASGIWSDDNTYTITLRYYETPFVYTFACHFANGRLTVDGAVNVSFGPTTYSLVGQVEK